MAIPYCYVQTFSLLYG